MLAWSSSSQPPSILQKAVVKDFWPLAENHCQNGLFSLRASHFSVWTEYLVFAAISIQQNLKLDRLPKPLPERLIFIAREPFFGMDRISGFLQPSGCIEKLTKL